MRKRLLIPVIVGLFSLVACDFMILFPPSGDNVVTEKPEGEDVTSYEVVDRNASNYVVGYTFSEDHDMVLRLTYESGKKYDEELEYFQINQVKYVDQDVVVDKSAPFESSGNYKAAIAYRYEGALKTSTLSFKVKSGLEAGYTLETFTFESNVNTTRDKKLSETNMDYTFTATWNTGEETVNETMLYSVHQNNINLVLNKNDETTNVYNYALTAGNSYVFKANLKKFPAIVASKSFVVSEAAGYYALEESALVYSDFNDVSPHKGKAKMAVILIDLEPGNGNYDAYEWTNANKNKVESFFFGNSEDSTAAWSYTLKDYYHQVSLNKIQVSGELFGPYVPEYTMAQVSADTSYQTLMKMFKSAVTSIKSTYSSVNWSEYDGNGDGYFDNLHFVTNCVTDGTDISWSSPLWPHQSSMGSSPGTSSSPTGNVYEMTAFGKLNNASVLIHEQGHMFGLPDYYDYSYSGADYIGYIDMQSYNCFDWNSWSKFSVGWANPYVIDGTLDSTTLTFQSSSTTNQCVVIPANIDTYNNSAFDEFFLIELITNDGNNTEDWDKYIGAAVNAACRVYHVDARLWEYHTKDLVDEPADAKDYHDRGYYVDLRTSNTTKFGDYAGQQREEDHDFKTLCLIQEGGEDTFGVQSGDTSSVPASHVLKKTDMFYTGDTFTFDQYKHFLSKSGRTVTTMDNGETFPYTITFDRVSAEGCQITVTKN